MRLIRRTKRPALLAAAGALLAAALAVPQQATAVDRDPVGTKAAANATVVPVQTTGPTDKRFNLVVLGDGYTAAEIPKFRADVEKHMNVLWSIEPFASYRSYINVWAVEMPSPESGVDCDPGLSDARRDTPLDMAFWGGCDANSVQRLLTVDTEKASAAADLVPGSKSANRQIVALANSQTYGGAGGAWATASGGNALSSLITPHEIGHSLGKLDDEYDYYGRGVPGGTYTGGEPDSTHHTLLSEEEMRTKQQKWWRWLGEDSLSGGRIGRHEGGMYSTKGVWRPSKHSMMKTLGYDFDQVEREVMTQAIANKVNLVQDHTPNTAPLGTDRTAWVDTLHPVGGALDVTWKLDGRTVPGTFGSRSLDLKRLHVGAGAHTLTATVTDPTPFVRDPKLRASQALTRTVTWTVDRSVRSVQQAAGKAEFTGHTGTDKPVGAKSVVYADTSHPATGRSPKVLWTVDGWPVASSLGNDRDLDLSKLRLPAGRTHTLKARIVTGGSGAAPLTWTVDTASATGSYELSDPVRTVQRPGKPVEYVYDGPFTMRLSAKDDQKGTVVSQFRVNGDGWYTYYGWPTDADAPWRFTPSGTNVDDLVYGKLGTPRVVPWDDATPEYKTHTIEYRTIDAAGNVGPAKKFLVTLTPPQA
ncbi:M64 family metallopeptidase [Streptomyces sp. NPDC021093]|uniref:M64 family metallopeptidase n=1 Tax=Streptomyces sp. NPDC021093 TaxID=3365112 RepID=UPI0037A929C6